ncbi:MAG: hypothetical protein U0840_28725 [Gemmataceae bacterium]
MTEMLTTLHLPRPLQRLIDARLDTIDRMLLGRLPRADRLAVVREVEAQVYELLGERPGHELDREDVLTVLAKLDPPEAYIPEEGVFEATAVLVPARPTNRPGGPAAEGRPALVVGILGLVLLGLVLLWPVTLLLSQAVGAGDNGVAVQMGESLVMFVAGVPVFVLSVIWRKGGAWAVVGIVAGTIGVLAGLATSVLLML